jgi:hypothetical protein
MYYLLWFCSPARAMVSSSMRFLDHTKRRTPVGRTLWTSDQLVAETSTCQHRHTQQTYMPPVGFEPMVAAGERP